MITWYGYVLIGLAGVAAGIVNALAGGGTLISFPLLTAVGVPPVVANVTNSVALTPGYLGATWAQAAQLDAQKKRLRWVIPVSILGGLAGGILLLRTGEKLFSALVPWLILLSAVLLAVQMPVRKWVMRRAQQSGSAPRVEAWAALPIGLVAVYGGYFGGGLGVIVMAVLGLTLEDSLTRLNAVKQVISVSVHLASALYFAFSGQVLWTAALVMAVGALAGGALGGRLVGKIKPETLRWIVVGIGTAVGLAYLLR
jgi:hypothetical protein